MYVAPHSPNAHYESKLRVGSEFPIVVWVRHGDGDGDGDGGWSDGKWVGERILLS